VGATIAAGPVDSSGGIHGCWTTAAHNGTHTFTLQDAGTTCPKGTTAITWNQTGPQGAQGPTGPQSRKDLLDQQGQQGQQGQADQPDSSGPFTNTTPGTRK